MFARKTSKINPEINIPVKLDEPLTTDSCLTIVMELLKYLLYEKQQVPFSCDSMQIYWSNIKPNDKNMNPMKTMLELLQSITKDLETQLHIEGCSLHEVVIAIGATIFSPKIIFRVELPTTILNSSKHKEIQHPTRRPLLNLMKSIFSCEEFQTALTVPVGLTNTFILLQKNDPNQKSEVFIPKPDYSIPTHVKSFRIKLDYCEEKMTNCSCESLTIYNDFKTEEMEDGKSKNFEATKNENKIFKWYQSRKIIKGFKSFR